MCFKTPCLTKVRLVYLWVLWLLTGKCKIDRDWKNSSSGPHTVSFHDISVHVHYIRAWWGILEKMLIEKTIHISFLFLDKNVGLGI